jgi:hypothetical protein
MPAFLVLARRCPARRRWHKQDGQSRLQNRCCPACLRHGDDAWCVERAADPLHRTGIDFELFGNDVRAGGGPARSSHYPWGSSQPRKKANLCDGHHSAKNHSRPKVVTNRRAITLRTLQQGADHVVQDPDNCACGCCSHHRFTGRDPKSRRLSHWLFPMRPSLLSRPLMK